MKKKSRGFVSRFYQAIGILSIVFAISVTINIFFDEIISPIEANASNYIQITVSPGDTLWNIAKEYHDGKDDIRNYMEEIKALNDMKNSNINIDQKLYIPIRII